MIMATTHIIRIVTLLGGLQFAAGFHLPTQRLSFSALSAANENDDGFSLDRRSAIATTGAAVLISLSISDPANALFPVGAFASTRPRKQVSVYAIFLCHISIQYTQFSPSYQNFVVASFRNHLTQSG